MSRVVYGIDPGAWSFGLCVLVDGEVEHVYQREAKRSEREGDDDRERWARLLSSALREVRADACGLEDVEPQTWVAGGRIPKGMVRLQGIVRDLDSQLVEAGVTVYRQSPNVQGDFDADTTQAMLAQRFGHTYDRILPHLVSATIHAWVADSTYLRATRTR